MSATTAPLGFAGPYKLRSVLGRGGMAAVYEAVAPDGTIVAVKRLIGPDDATTRLRFAREMRMRIVHPNVVRVLDAGDDATGRPYLVLERLTGAPLSTVLAKGAMPPPEATRVVMDVASALAAVHARGIVHRDVKPHNVFVCADGTVKLLDFGIALERESAEPRLTSPTNVVGTPAYMAPEQLRRAQELDARVDIWALGCLLQACLTGHPPFAGRSNLEISAAVLQGARTPLPSGAPDVSHALEAILDRCLQVDPGARFGSVDEVRDALRVANESAVAAPEHRTIAAATADWEALRVVALAMLAGVRDARAVMAGIRAHGGTPFRLDDDRVVGAWGGASSLGEELEHAMKLARALADEASTIGIVLGHASSTSGRLRGEGLRRAEELVRAGRRGIVVDAHAARALASKRRVRPNDDAGRQIIGVNQGETGPLVGRGTELAFARNAMDEAWRSGRSTTTVFVGEPGAGKSRLAQAIEDEATRRGYVVLSVRSTSAQRAPFEAIREAVRALFPSALQVEALASEVEALGVELADAAEVARALAHPAAGRDATAALQFAVWRVVSACARTSRTCLLVDDHHLLDAREQQWLASLPDAAEGAGMAIFFTTRGGEAPVPSGARILSIGPMSVEEVADLAEYHLGVRPREASCRALLAHTGGRALFVDQVLRELAASGVTAKDEAFPLPASVEAAVQAQLDRMSTPARAVLRWVALLGRPCATELLESLLGADPREPLDALVDAGLLVRGPDREGRDTNRIAHAVFAFAVKATFGTEDARAAHLRIAEALATNQRSDAEEIAEHYALAGRFGPCARWLEHAAEDAYRYDAFATGARLLSTLERHGLPASCLTLFLTGQAAFAAADLARVEATVSELQRRARSPRDRAFTAVLAARMVVLRGEPRQISADALERARALSIVAGEWRLAAHALRSECAARMRLGQFDRGRRASIEFRRIAPTTDPSVSMSIFATEASLSLFEGRLDDALHWNTSFIALAEQHGLSLPALTYRSYALDLEARFGRDVAEELEAVAERLARHEETLAAATAWANAADTHARHGRFDRARRIFERLRREQSLRGTRDYDGIFGLYEARLALLEGRPRDALRRLDGALDGAFWFIVVLGAALRADAHRDLGETAQALTDSEEALSQLERHGGLPEDEGEVYLTRIRALESAGLHAEGARVRAQARRRIRERAAIIVDPELRAAFLEQVPAHRELLKQ